MLQSFKILWLFFDMDIFVLEVTLPQSNIFKLMHKSFKKAADSYLYGQGKWCFLLCFISQCILFRSSFRVLVCHCLTSYKQSSSHKYSLNALFHRVYSVKGFVLTLGFKVHVCACTVFYTDRVYSAERETLCVSYGPLSQFTWPIDLWSCASCVIWKRWRF